MITHTISTWLPKEVVNKTSELRNTEALLTKVNCSKDFYSTNHVLSNKQIETLYDGLLQEYYINWEFICFNV